MGNVVHKADYKRTFSRYAGFGTYEQIPSPLCVGPTPIYNGKSYQIHRNWKYVTCKHCLKKKNN